MRPLLPAHALLIIGLLASGGAHAQVTPTFATEAPLELKLTGPFGELGRNPEDRPEHPAVIEFSGPDGEPMSLDIEIRIRGNSRVRECQYPPLSLDFPRSQTTGTVFEGQNRLKLAVLCRNGNAHLGYLAQEFLIYRMFNLLTDRSFRVRWATVQYLDTSARRPEPRLAPAFLIEEDWELAERLGMDVIDIEEIDPDALDTAHTALISVFQYLIGNTDWSVILGPPGENCCHNGKVIGRGDGPYYVVPYDFDNSGLINAAYAVPSEVLGITRVTQRVYRGFCRWNPALPDVIAELNRQRDRMMSVFESELLDDRPRRSALEFLNESFEVINDPEDLEDRIYGSCG